MVLGSILLLVDLLLIFFCFLKDCMVLRNILRLSICKLRDENKKIRACVSLVTVTQKSIKVRQLETHGYNYFSGFMILANSSSRFFFDMKFVFIADHGLSAMLP